MSEPALSQPGTERIALSIEYDGAAFSGWQKQLSPLLATIQLEVETALSKIANHPVTVICAGRTDTGVHATSQVIHFDAQIDRGEKAWIVGTNSLLVKSVRVLTATRVAADFHARFSALSRRYYYIILQRKIAPAILYKRVTHIAQELDVAAMNLAAQALLGEQDFSSFRAASCQSRSPFREVTRAHVFRQGAFVVLDIQANAFLQHMVRNIVGSLLEIGQGRQSTEWLHEVLSLHDRNAAAMTAPPDGLYLVSVAYPDKFQLPLQLALPSFLDFANP